MPYKISKKFENLKHIKITKLHKDKFWLTTVVEHALLFQFGFTGYYNTIDSKRRIVSAMGQTIWAIIVLNLIRVIFNYIFVTNYHVSFKISNQLSYKNYAGIAGVVAAIFGANFIREMKDIHNKFDYLAKLFNDVIKIKPIQFKKINHQEYNQREHLAACLAHDILIMNMWAHRSFQGVFKDIFEKAIILDLYNKKQFSETTIEEMLNNIADHGIDLSEVKRLISNYVEHWRDESDKPETFFDTLNGRLPNAA